MVFYGLLMQEYRVPSTSAGVQAYTWVHEGGITEEGSLVPRRKSIRGGSGQEDAYGGRITRHRGNHTKRMQ